MGTKLQSEYLLLLAVRDNTKIPQNDYLRIIIISAIDQKLKDAIELCDSKSESDDFISNYYRNRQEIIYEEEEKEDMERELKYHEDINDWEFDYHTNIINNFQWNIGQIFTDIFDLLYVKYIIDEDFYFFGKIIENPCIFDLEFFAAACCGLSIDYFFGENRLEVVDDIASYPDYIIYADAYKAFLERLILIDESLSGKLSVLNIKNNFSERLPKLKILEEKLTVLQHKKSDEWTETKRKSKKPNCQANSSNSDDDFDIPF